MTTLNQDTWERVHGKMTDPVFYAIIESIKAEKPDFYEPHVQRSHAIIVTGMTIREAMRQFNVTGQTIGYSLDQVARECLYHPHQTVGMIDFIRLWHGPNAQTEPKFYPDIPEPPPPVPNIRGVLMVDPESKRYESLNLELPHLLANDEQLKHYVINWRGRTWTYAETLRSGALATLGVEVMVFSPAPVIEVVSPEGPNGELPPPDSDD